MRNATTTEIIGVGLVLSDHVNFITVKRAGWIDGLPQLQ